jgi:hypothetical protein
LFDNCLHNALSFHNNVIIDIHRTPVGEDVANINENSVPEPVNHGPALSNRSISLKSSRSNQKKYEKSVSECIVSGHIDAVFGLFDLRVGRRWSQDNCLYRVAANDAGGPRTRNKIAEFGR